MASIKTCNGFSQIQGNTSKFNIENDGDPDIPWFMYYDFIFSENEAYYQLQPAYSKTTRYPTRLDHENIIIDGENLHLCRVQGCSTKPFTRHCDLERHFKIHQISESISCDYMDCPYRIQHRRGQLRWHYRQHHGEDLDIQGQMQAEKMMETIGTTQNQDLDLTWWRCSKCLLRVEVDDSQYNCLSCKVACEPERVARRETPSISQHPSWNTSFSAKTSIEKDHGRDHNMQKIELITRVPRQQYLTSITNGRRYIVTAQKLLFIRSNYDHNFDCFLITLALVAGVLMGILYAWVNQRIGFRMPSESMQQIVLATKRVMPAALIEASHLVSPNLILMSYLAWAAVWTISIVGWATSRSKNPWFVYSYVYLLLTTIFWVLSNVTPEELLLVFLPVSLSTGGLLCTICDKSIKKGPSRIANNNGHTSLAIQAAEDLEMNSKA